MLKKEVKEALKVAKELEKQEPMPREKVVEIYKEGIETAQSLQKLLKPDWFLKEEKAKAQRRKPSAKKKH